MTKSLRTENVIQFVNHDKKSNMKNKFDDIFNSWKDNSFPYQPKKIFKLFNSIHNFLYFHQKTQYRICIPIID